MAELEATEPREGTTTCQVVPNGSTQRPNHHPSAPDHHARTRVVLTGFLRSCKLPRYQPRQGRDCRKCSYVQERGCGLQDRRTGEEKMMTNAPALHKFTDLASCTVHQTTLFPAGFHTTPTSGSCICFGHLFLQTLTLSLALRPLGGQSRKALNPFLGKSSPSNTDVWKRAP